MPPVDLNDTQTSTIKTPWSRAERPCDACRRRKTRCVLLETAAACNLCLSRKKECTFVQDPPRSRKRHKTVQDEQGLQQDRSHLATTNLNSPHHDSPESNNTPGQPIGFSPSVDTCAPIDDNTVLKESGGLKNRRSTIYMGKTAFLEPLLLNRSLPNRRPTHPRVLGTYRHVSPGTFLRQNPDSQNQHDEDIVLLDEIQKLVAPYGQNLIDIYFRIAHPSFPILHKRDFLERYTRTYREFEPSLLLAIYILALDWWPYSPALSMLEPPDVSKLDKLVPMVLMNVANRPKISTVQALLLLLQRPNGASWALIGHLVATGQDLGLNLDCSSWNIPQWEKGLRKRLAWAIFVQDAWGSMMYGRTLLTHLDDWLVEPLNGSDFEEVNEDVVDLTSTSEANETGELLFMHMVTLTRILADVLRSFFSLKAQQEIEELGKDKMSVILNKVKAIQLDLKSWFTQLPAQLRIHQSRVGKLSSSGYLHLAYYATEITIHRLLVYSVDSAEDNPALVAVVRKAAETRLTAAIQFVADLRPEQLQGFWYFASITNFALIGTFGILLWSTSTSEEEADFLSAKLSEYRWHLQVNSKAADFMKVAVELLDASVLSFNDVRFDPRMVTSRPSARPPVRDNEFAPVSASASRTTAVGGGTPMSTAVPGTHVTTRHNMSVSPAAHHGDSALSSPGFQNPSNSVSPRGNVFSPSAFDVEVLGTIWDEPGFSDL